MGFQVSPGVRFSETDLTGIVPVSSTTDAAYAGWFRWGPAYVPVLVSHEGELLSVFGKPDLPVDDFQGSVSFFTCASFLTYGDTLKIVRTVDNSSHLGRTHVVESIDLDDGTIRFEGTLGAGAFGENGAGVPAVQRLDTISVAGFDGIPDKDLVILGVEYRWRNSDGELFDNPTDAGKSPGATPDLSITNIHYATPIPTELVNLFDKLASEGESLDLQIKCYTGALNATSDQKGALILNDQHYDEYFSLGQASVGAWAAKYPGVLGNSLSVAVCASADAYSTQLAGTASTSYGDENGIIDLHDYTTDSAKIKGDGLADASGGHWIVGTNTSFLTHLIPGSVVVNKRNNESRVVMQVVSDDLIQIDSKFDVDLDDATLIGKWEFADLFSAPNASSYAEKHAARHDELHIVVVDKTGKFTGLPGTILERFEALSKAPNAKLEDGSTNYYKDVINTSSNYIRWTDHLVFETLVIGSSESLWGSKIEPGVNFFSPSLPARDDLSGGTDGETSNDDHRVRGYDLFADPDVIDVSLIITGNGSSTVCNYVINNICHKRLDCVAFVSPPLAAVKRNSGHEVDSITKFRNRLPSTSYAVMDSGWKEMFDKYNNAMISIPLNGDIAGLCAQTDSTQDPWWSPAGYTRGQIKNAESLYFSPNKVQRDALYKINVNPVMDQPGEGKLLFGDKTLLTKPSAFDRINVRRLFIVLEKNISRMSKYLLFEFNDEFTRQQFRSMVEPFLRDIQSRRGIYDFRVICDRTNNTPEVIDRNEFVGDIYVKPARAINFIQLNFIAVRTGVEFSEIVGRV